MVVPGTAGRFEVLEHHAPIVSSLEQGEVAYTVGQETHSIAIHGGFILVKKTKLASAWNYERRTQPLHWESLH